MSLFPLKPTHKPVKDYYAALARFHQHGHKTEGNTRSAFADLLKKCASPYKWHLVEEYPFKGTNKQPLRADGAIFDNDLPVLQGLWEAKDTNDDLDREIKSKVAKGYPLANTLFQSPDRAVLYQDNRIAFDDSIASPEKLIDVLECFFSHKLADIPDWEEAVTKFADEIPKLAQGVTTILENEYAKNPAFRENFQSFAELCRQSINPDLTDDAIRKMLVQHLLTERIFRKVFNNQEFLQRNVIAAEIEKVIRSITARHFAFLPRNIKPTSANGAGQTGVPSERFWLVGVERPRYSPTHPDRGLKAQPIPTRSRPQNLTNPALPRGG